MIRHPTSRLLDDIYWVGAIDWNLRDFHGFSVTRGATYNAFLVDGPEPVVVDTVKEPFAGEYLARIAEVVPPEKVRHLIINHVEPDHSGAFPAALAAMPRATVYATENAISGLHRYHAFDRKIRLVHDDETLELGGRPYRFIETPMVHWPDSMVTYLPRERALFSSDIFGQLLATSERLDTEIEPPYGEAALYYANIILPFNALVLKTLDRLAALEDPPEVILPDHGIVWTRHRQGILDRYRSWADGSCARGALVLYDTMWGSTEIMARRLYDRLTESNLKVQLLHLRSNPMSRVVTEIMLAKAVLIGTPTLNDTIFPSVGQLLCYLQGLRPGPGRLWGGFGSRGWGGGGMDALMRWYRENQYEVIADPVESRFRPAPDIEQDLDRMARAVIERLAAEG